MVGWYRGASVMLEEAPPANGEVFSDLVVLGGVRVEQIVSSRHPDTSLQVQEHDEWVVLLRGSARLSLESDGVMTDISLAAGQTLFIGAHTPHRVLQTSDGAVWLALHAPRRSAA